MKINPDEVYWNSDHTAYAVLISPGYGFGWATRNYSDMNRIAWDKRIVEFVLVTKGRDWEDACFDGKMRESTEKHTEFCEILKTCEIDPKRVCFNGGKNLEIVWVKPGDKWQIDEYDGAESVVIFNDKAWLEV